MIIDNDFSYINKDLVYEVLSVPTYTKYEFRLATYIVLWARRNKIDYELDEYGNVYLTKGQVEDGEFYPCVTSHMDTVQSGQKELAQIGLNLQIKTRVNDENKHELYVDGMGIGADCKSGVAISLSLFKHCKKLKACFFLEEETGMIGAYQLNKEWFKDVGYVIGWDSPELNRAAWCCNGTKLFNKDFFVENIQTLCYDHGVTTFNMEPYTDVKAIRELTNIVCMNFGNGGYHAHCSNEYCVIEDIDAACKMGVALIEHLGNKQYLIDVETIDYRYKKLNENKIEDTDIKFFTELHQKEY